MYLYSAALYDLMHPNLDYDTAVSNLRLLIAQHRPGATSLLDVACGTGRHLALLAPELTVEGLDISEGMLEMARQRCPDVPLHLGDMRSFDLGKRFDVVTCLFSSIGYVGNFDELVETVQTLVRHVVPGGLVIVEPWLTPERYRVGAVTSHTAEEEGRRVSWMYSALLDGDRSVFDIHHLVGTPSGVEHFIERHSLALFTAQQYEQAFRLAGLEPQVDESGLFGYGMLTAVVPEVSS
jgi:ubiquinone/menaquinone biosynthesis C-methylase UbiE